jgi:P-type Ca2+ transporter type 2C
MGTYSEASTVSVASRHAVKTWTGDRAAIPVAIRPVHRAVPGRARVSIAALKGSPATEGLLDRGLAVAPGVSSAKACRLTGNVLLFHDVAVSLDEILGYIAALLRGDIELPQDQALAGQAAWHLQAPGEVAAELETSPALGLADEAARDRLAKTGYNVLPTLAGRSRLSLLAEQFQSLPVALLAGAAVVSIATGALLEAAAIAGVVLANAAIGYRTEDRAERVIESLTSSGPDTARVIRGGIPQAIPAKTIVPGDLLLLQRGMIIPADARLTSVRELTVSEASLTGESRPIAKSTQALALPVPLSGRTSMVYRGAIVTGGSATAIVVATGTATEAGRIARLVSSAEPPETPMQQQLADLGRQLVWPTLAACGLIMGFGWLRGFALLQMTRSALATAVAAVPEGLPMVATTTLAFGVEELQKHDIHVRKLHAIEALAAVQVICFDKTGTLTVGRMSVTAVATGEHIHQSIASLQPRSDVRVDRLFTIACLCSEIEIGLDNDRLVLDGSATEGALVQAAHDCGIDAFGLREKFGRLSIQHRSESYRFMATSHAAGAGFVLAVKGSPAEVLERCRWEMTADGARRLLTPARRSEIEHQNGWMAEQALRVLGFAYREEEPVPALEPAGEPAIEDLTWVGLAGMADPIRPAVHELIEQLHQCGVQTIMLTGDQSATARAVAERIGLNGNGDIGVVDASELDTMDPAELAAAAGSAHAFSRVSPAQKLQIVRALQDSGRVVAMLGDGINDGPALRAANVGIGFGRDGAMAAREIADVFIASDDLGSLLVAIETGRKIHSNVRKSIRFLLSTNSSEILLMVAGTALGFGQALSPVQLLWINLISDVLPGIGLALEPAGPDALRRPPPAVDDPILHSRDYGPLASEAAILGAGAFASGLYGTALYGANSPRTRTLMFSSLVLAQLLHAPASRSRRHSVFSADRLPPNPILNKIVLGSIGLQAAALLVPGIRNFLGVGTIGPIDAMVALAGGTVPFVIGEMRKSTRDDDGVTPADPAAP